MSVVLQQLERAYKMDMDKMTIEAVRLNQKEIVDINRDQMRMGKSGKGEMPGYRSAAYLNYKRSLASYFAGNKTDLYLTGAFQKSMFMRISGKDIEITSSDYKTPQLLEKYGEEIFEFGNEFKPFVYEMTTPTFYKLCHDFLQAK